ncbi:MAG TPA: hypothetical protein VIV12_23590 [Streptosporangiaceae bacterium]
MPTSSNTPQRPPSPPWRLLVLSRGPDDAWWAIATITLPEDVTIAALDAAGRYTDWDEVCAWARERIGRGELSLYPAGDPLVWVIEETGRPR